MDRQDNTIDRYETDPTFGESAAQIDWDSPEQPSTAIVEAVAAATDADLLEMPPLTHAIPPDTLNTIFTVEGNPRRESVQISFAYSGVHVRVDRENGIEIREPREDAEQPR